MPSALPDPPTPFPSLSDFRDLPAHPLADAVFAIFPIPREFDCTRIVSWGEFMRTQQFRFDVATLEWLTVLSSHTVLHLVTIQLT